MAQDLAQHILEEYSEFALQNDQSRYNVWLYCQYLEIEEEDFYNCYPNLKTVEQTVWSALMSAAIETSKEDDQYETFSAHQKLLTVLYTFFENLALNRSFVLLSLSGYTGRLDQLSLLSELRKVFVQYVDQTFDRVVLNPLLHPLSKNQFLKMKGFKEGFWLQLLSLISFWKNDRSPQFEQTDAAIEKSMRVASELIEKVPKDSMMDLGKFLLTNWRK